MTEGDVLIYERGSFKFGVTTVIEPEALNMLKSMTVGSGGMKYKHNNIDVRMEQTKNKYFMYIRQSKKVKATATISFRETSTAQGMINAYYVRYFMINNNIKGLSSKKGGSGNKGAIKKMISRHMLKSPANYGIGYDENTKLPSLFYAFFDEENYRSTEICELLGLSLVSRFETFAFSRLNPSKYDEVEKLDAVHYDNMRRRINAYYENFSIYTDQFLFVDDAYYVLRENGEIVAGVQANKCEWEIKKMKGMMGAFAIHILPNIPGVRKYFNPKKFEFIIFDYIYVKPGYEDKLRILFTHLLSVYKVKFSLTWQDIKNPLWNILNKIDRGIFSNLSSSPPGRVMMTLSELKEADISELKDKPFFTCAMDMS